jgi:mono/diheme cytochrome c family protein
MKSTGVAHRHKILFATLGGIVLLLLGAGVGVVILLSGAMSTAATTQHFRLTHRLLEAGLRFSVNTAADDIAEPSLDEPGMLETGAACFRQYCVQCHGSPGQARDDAAKGMLPVPNPLAESARVWSPAALYVITSKGVRMTGMPAWEFRISEHSLWSTVAFLAKLPALSRADYHRLAADSGVRCERSVVMPPATEEIEDEVLLRQYACHACHRIDGVVGPTTYVGPPLAEWHRRKYVAGELPNTYDNLTAFIMSPQASSPGSLMPDLAVPEAHARRIAAFLLREP